jgi:hypothetical protein
MGSLPTRSGKITLMAVRVLEKDVPRLKDYAHSTLSQSRSNCSEHRVLARQAAMVWWHRRPGTVVYFVRETAPTGWTFFHLVGSSLREAKTTVVRLILAAVRLAGNH